MLVRAVYSQQNPTFTHAAFVASSFVLRHSHTEQSATHPPKHGAGSESTQRAYHGTCGREALKPWQNEGSRGGQIAEQGPYRTASGSARRRAFRSLAVFFMPEVLGSYVLRHEYGYVRRLKADLLQGGGGIAHRRRIWIKAVHRMVFHTTP
jgi:hypothetical protein